MFLCKRRFETERKRERKLYFSYPQKIKHRENISCARLLPVSADSTPAITIELKVDVKSRNKRIIKNMVPPRETTESVGIAFRCNPIG